MKALQPAAGEAVEGDSRRRPDDEGNSRGARRDE
jgi:hypothetical protein